MCDESCKRDVLWDAADVAKFLKLTRCTVYRRVAAGTIPHMRVLGTLIRFDPCTIRRLAGACKVA